ncbi:MAG TPA: sigma-70 family RNA polymerase sigma factor [Blastocatellia bacterium]|nr:sigma-70 family RNA polymerase sigma factor [Blastocatellia bacterium]
MRSRRKKEADEPTARQMPLAPDAGFANEGEGMASLEVAEGAERAALRADEDGLIRRSLAADHDAFEVLVRRYSPRVFNIIGSFFRRRDMIEDIAQEVFSRAYFSLGTFTLGRSFEAWVAKIAVNACYDHLRAQRRRSEHNMPQGGEREDEWLELQMLEAARDRHASAERQREAADIAERLLAKLDPEDRLVVVLMDREGFSVSEIAEVTGWGHSKIKVRAFRARRTLRAAMKRLLMTAERKRRSLEK